MRNIRTQPNIGRRIVAGLIDYGIIYSFTFILILLLGEPDVEGGVYHLNGAPAFLPILIWLLLTAGFESLLGGTLGNSIVRLKVLPMHGKNQTPTFIQSLKRHLLDPIDMCFFGMVGIITISNTDRNQRVGDLWAKTIVVKMRNLPKENPN